MNTLNTYGTALVMTGFLVFVACHSTRVGKRKVEYAVGEYMDLAYGMSKRVIQEYERETGKSLSESEQAAFREGYQYGFTIGTIAGSTVTAVNVKGEK